MEITERLQRPGEYLLFAEDGHEKVVALTREWTRIGRSLIADLRLDDTTVSRRHALLGRQPDGVRLLDDRSLNGVFVNGERVEWTILQDGDEIEIGRYRLNFISSALDSEMSRSREALRC
jgi:pSer/pThr/pTyr-binding forkhead associated (FHA) protein